MAKAPAPTPASSDGPTPPATAGEPTPQVSVSLSEGALLRSLPRVVSLVALVAVLVYIAVLFFKMIASFLVPLFLAAVLTVIFKPLHNWILERLGGSNQLAALATTLLISLGVLVPTGLLGWMAFVETQRIVKVAVAASKADATLQAAGAPAPNRAPDQDDEAPDPEAPADPQRDADGADEQPPAEAGWTAALRQRFDLLTDWFHENVSPDFDPAKAVQSVAESAVKLGLNGVQTLLGLVLGMGIMVFALYFFFADGPRIIEQLMHLSPLDDNYEHELLARFASVSRAVVLAILLAAFVQGILGGIGYFFVLEEWTPPSLAAAAEAAGREVTAAEKVSPPVFLLTVLTMLLAIIPFVGATAVWIPVAAWVYFMQEDTWAAIGMTAYGFGIVSSIDNLIKPYVLHGQSNLHPLLALMSVIGGLQLLGPVGILVGPMLVAFLQALLLMLRKELDVLASHGEPTTPPA